jgi:hypothetical protein
MSSLLLCLPLSLFSYCVIFSQHFASYIHPYYHPLFTEPDNIK